MNSFLVIIFEANVRVKGAQLKGGVSEWRLSLGRFVGFSGVFIWLGLSFFVTVEGVWCLVDGCGDSGAVVAWWVGAHCGLSGVKHAYVPVVKMV